MAAPARLDFEDYFASNYQTEYEAKPQTVIEEEPQIAIVRPEKLTKAQRKAQERLANRKWLRITAVISSLFVLAALNAMAISQNDNSYREIQTLQNELKLKQSEAAQLNAQISSLVSFEKVEKIAVEELGLIKLSSADWEYVNLASENSIVFSQAETD